ncbi:MAG: hypothetical protein HUU55_14135 [Myxococcales bacterium]|nr:hypothetical protein [Myxococcales bacterium]
MIISDQEKRCGRHVPSVVISTLIVVCCFVSCAETAKESPHPPTELAYPTNLALDATGRYLFVVSSNFDLRYDGAAIQVLDLTTHTFLPDAAIQLPSFPGILTLREKNGKSANGYVPVRETDSLAWFDIVWSDTNPPTPDLRCGGNADNATGIEICSEDYRLKRKEIPNKGTLRVGNDPFGIGIRTSTGIGDDILFTGALRDGILAVYRLDHLGKPRLVDNRTLASGLYGIATSPATGVTYVSTQLSQQVYTIETAPEQVGLSTSPAEPTDPTEAEASPVTSLGAFGIPNVSSAVNYGQSIHFNKTGTRAYLVMRSPPSVVIIDTTPGMNGVAKNQVIGFVDVGARPAELAVVSQSNGIADRLYVPCFGSGDLYVIDTAIGATIDIVHLGVGPYDIVVTDQPTLGLNRAYISMFEESAIAVVELNPTDPFFHQVIAKIRSTPDYLIAAQ